MTFVIDDNLADQWRKEAHAHRGANSGGDGSEPGWIIATTLDRCATMLESYAGRLSKGQILDVAADVCQSVAELPDRTSPDDQPDMMLVTHDELQAIVTATLSASPHPAKAGVGGIDKDVEIYRLRAFANWVDSWVSKPVVAYSVCVLDDLFSITRDRLAALAGPEHTTVRTKP